MELTSTLSSVGIALGLGLLVGLQREQAATQLAGLRTFALITVLGTICGFLSLSFGGWILAAGFLALTGAMMTGRVAELKDAKTETGVTTEVAALAMFSLGAYIVIGYREVAIVVGYSDFAPANEINGSSADRQIGAGINDAPGNHAPGLTSFGRRIGRLGGAGRRIDRPAGPKAG